MTQAVQNPMAGWEPNLHPRDSHGRFRDKWGLPEAAKKLIQGILKNWNSPSFKSDAHAQAYLDQQAKKKKRSPQTQAAIDYFMSEPGNEDIQSTLRANAVGKLYPQIEALDEAMVPLDHDLILTRVLGPDAFGLPPERIGEVEEWTGKLLTDLGYQPTNAGTPHPVSGPHITMSILAPHGTRAVVPGDSRAVILDREQPLRVTKVEPDGHGGLFMYAVVAPKQGNKEASRSLGKELAPGELSPAIEATPEELAKRGLDSEGNPIPPGDMAPAAAPVAAPGPAPNSSPSAPTPAKMTQVEPATPLAGPSTDVHQKKIDDLKAKIEADKAAGKEPAKEDIKKLADAEGQLKAEPPAPEPAPIEGPDSKPAFKDKNLEPGPEHPDKVAKKQAAKAAQQETAKAEAPAAAAATVDELINKKASNQTIAQHLRSIASGPQLDGIDDEGDRQALRDDLERAADAFQDDNPMEGKKIIRSLSRATGVEMQGKAGEKVDYDPSVHDAVNPEGLKAGDKVEVIKAGATMRRKDGSLVHLDRAMVKRSSDASSSPEAPKTPEKKTSFGAPKISRAERLAALQDVKKPATKKVTKKAAKAAPAPKTFNEKDLGKNTVVQLRAHAKEKGIKVPAGTRKEDIISLIQDHNAAGATKPDLPTPEVVDPGKPLPKKILSAPTGKFGVAEDPGANGDGYHSTGKWGLYGAAGALIRAPGDDGQQRYLLVQRGPGVSHNKGKWQLPGGALNGNEDSYQGASREIGEELSPPGGYVDGLTPVGEHVYDGGDGWKYTTIAADASSTFDPKVDGTETGDAKWLTREEIQKMADDGELTPSTKKSLLAMVDDHEALSPSKSTPKKAAPAKTVPAKKVVPAKKAAPVKAAPKPKPELTEAEKLNKKLVKDLRAMAEEKGIKIPPGTRKADLIKYLTGEITPPPPPAPKPKSIPAWMDAMNHADLIELARTHGIDESLTTKEIKQALAEAKVTKPKAPPKKTLTELKQEADKLGVYHWYGISKKDLEERVAHARVEYEKNKAELIDLPAKAQAIFDQHSGDGDAFKLTGKLNDLLSSNSAVDRPALQAVADHLGVGEEFKGSLTNSGYSSIHSDRSKLLDLIKAKAEADRKGIPLGVAAGNLHAFKRVGPQGGSNPGGVFEAPDGSRWYIKAQKTAGHAGNERKASLLYRLAGIDVPEVHVATVGPEELKGEGSSFTASRIVPGAKSDLHSRVTGGDEEYLAKIYEGFAIDAWLGNWDAAGSGWDNIVTDEAGNPVRIDTGGAMAYRAQGGEKGLAWGPIATEWDSFQDPDSSRPLVQMYRGMTEEQRTRAVERLAQITPERLSSMMLDLGLRSSDVHLLVQRRDDILSREHNRGVTPFYADAKIGNDVAPSAIVGTNLIDQRLAGTGLSQNEITAASYALHSYQGSSYEYMAGHLRTPGSQGDNIQGLIDDIDRAMSHAELTEDVIVYRGERNPSRSFPDGVWSLTGGMEGMEWTFPTYSSTSANEAIAKSFADGHTSNSNGTAQPTVFRIRVPKGHHAIALDGGSMSHEVELLLPHHLRYRVVKDHGVDSTGTRRLDVEVLETSGDEAVKR